MYPRENTEINKVVVCLLLLLLFFSTCDKPVSVIKSLKLMVQFEEYALIGTIFFKVQCYARKNH